MPELVKLLKSKMNKCKVDSIKDIPKALDRLGPKDLKGHKIFVGNIDKITNWEPNKKKADYIVAICHRNLVVIESKGKRKSRGNPTKPIAQIEQTIEYINSKIIAEGLNGINIIPVLYRIGGAKTNPRTRVKGCGKTITVIKKGKSLRQKLGKVLNLP